MLLVLYIPWYLLNHNLPLLIQNRRTVPQCGRSVSEAAVTVGTCSPARQPRYKCLPRCWADLRGGLQACRRWYPASGLVTEWGQWQQSGARVRCGHQDVPPTGSPRLIITYSQNRLLGWQSYWCNAQALFPQVGFTYVFTYRSLILGIEFLT